MWKTSIQTHEGCCSPKLKTKAQCPKCHVEAKGVLAKTLQALLKEEAKGKIQSFEGWHFCRSATCEVIYFKETSVLKQHDVSIDVGCKVWASPAMVCYCFDWSKEKIKAELKREGKSTAQANIKAKMAGEGCSCEVLNPSGGCCLADVGKLVKEYT